MTHVFSGGIIDRSGPDDVLDCVKEPPTKSPFPPLQNPTISVSRLENRTKPPPFSISTSPSTSTEEVEEKEGAGNKLRGPLIESGVDFVSKTETSSSSLPATDWTTPSIRSSVAITKSSNGSANGLRIMKVGTKFLCTLRDC